MDTLTQQPRATNTERVGVRDNKRECQRDHQEALYNCIPSRCLIDACRDIEMRNDTKTIHVQALSLPPLRFKLATDFLVLQFSDIVPYENTVGQSLPLLFSKDIQTVYVAASI